MEIGRAQKGNNILLQGLAVRFIFCRINLVICRSEAEKNVPQSEQLFSDEVRVARLGVLIGKRIPLSTRDVILGMDSGRTNAPVLTFLPVLVRRYLLRC